MRFTLLWSLSSMKFAFTYCFDLVCFGRRFCCSCATPSGFLPHCSFQTSLFRILASTQFGSVHHMVTFHTRRALEMGCTVCMTVQITFNQAKSHVFVASNNSGSNPLASKTCLVLSDIAFYTKNKVSHNTFWSLSCWNACYLWLKSSDWFIFGQLNQCSDALYNQKHNGTPD